MRVDVVDVDVDQLRRPAALFRILVVLSGRAEHDDTVPHVNLGVVDTTVIALHPDLRLNRHLVL